MKKLLIILGLALMVVPCISDKAAAVQKEAGFISVNASEVQEIVPNTANISFAIETTNIDSKVATEQNNEITQKVVIALKEELITDKTSMVQTKNFTLNPNYRTIKENGVSERVIQSYTAKNSILVKTTDIEKIGVLIDKAIKNNVTTVGNISFSIENQEQYNDKLIKAAIEKARDMAQSAAEELNQKITGIKTLRLNVYQQNSNGARLYTSSLKADSTSTGISSTPIESGKIKLNASVDAEFYVK